MNKILFLCSANVWRSQIAQAIFENMYWRGTAMSAALHEDKVDKYLWKPDTAVLNVLRQNSIDHKHLKISLVTKEMLRQAKEIIVLCHVCERNSELKIEEQYAFEYVSKNFSEKIRYYEVSDPYGRENMLDDVFKSIFHFIHNMEN